MNDTNSNTSTALDIASASSYKLAQLPKDGFMEVMETLRDNIGPEGFSEQDLTRIGIPGAGGMVWAVPNMDGTESAMPAIEGVIVGRKNVRLMWGKAFGDGQAEPPVCTSDDGIHGHGKYADACRGICKDCPMAQFGTAVRVGGKSGRGQACQARTVLFFLTPGDMIPKVISVPPGSLFRVKEYLMGLSNIPAPYCGVVSKFWLTPEKNEDGIKYSEVRLSLVGKLSADEAKIFKAYAAMFAPLISRTTAIDSLPVTEGGTKAPSQGHTSSEPMTAAATEGDASYPG